MKTYNWLQHGNSVSRFSRDVTERIDKMLKRKEQRTKIEDEK